MWRSKKFIVVALLAVVVLVGSTAGIVLAQENGDDSQPKTLLARVAEILSIDQQKLEDAFIQAQSDMRDEALQKLVQVKLYVRAVWFSWMTNRPLSECARARASGKRFCLAS